MMITNQRHFPHAEHHRLRIQFPFASIRPLFCPRSRLRRRIPMSVSTNVAIVDDRDPAIDYVGAWVSAGAAEEFKSSTTVSVTPGTTASFTFNGMARSALRLYCFETK